MTAELIIGIGPETLEFLTKLATETLRLEPHTPLDRFAALVLKGINENMKSDLPDGVGTVVHITGFVTAGFTTPHNKKS